MPVLTETQTPIPTGVVTLLFTDIAGSSRLWETHGDAFISVWQTHDALMHHTIRRFGGYVVKTEGDAFMVAFSDPKAALYCAIFAQIALMHYPWPQDVGIPRVRMGLHTGSPFIQNNDYFGPTVNRAAYICAKAVGGQIIISSETHEAIATRVDKKIHIEYLGEVPLKGQSMLHGLYTVVHPNMQELARPKVEGTSSVRTCMVGNSRGLENIASFLSMGDRPILSVMGSTGVGRAKVRMETEEFKPEWFPEGVWYARLNSSKNLNEAAMEVAFALNLPFASTESVLTELRAWLSDQRALLILDDARPDPIVDRLVRELLSGAEALKCIATSSRSMKMQERAEPVVSKFPNMADVPPVTVQPEPPLPREYPTPQYVSPFATKLPTEAMNLKLSEQNRAHAERLLKNLEEPIITPVPTANPMQMWIDPLRPLVNSTIASEQFRKRVKDQTQRVLSTSGEVAKTLLSGIGQIVQSATETRAERPDAKPTP